MKIEFEMFDALCTHRLFKINNIHARYEDFGEQYDRSPQTSEPYGCGDMSFSAKPATQSILDKYKITPDEYIQICDMLTDKMSWGNCNWCS